MLDELKTARRVVGVKQLRKALRRGEVSAVYLARSADPALTEPLAAEAEDLHVSVYWVPSMTELGAACRISVGAAAAGILR